MKKQITQMLRDRIDEQSPQTESPNSTNDKTSTEGTNYDKITNILKNDIINTAAICKIVLGDNDASKRSLFGKKLNRDTNDNGSIYHFDEDELMKISTALMSFSTQIRKSIGKEGK